MRLYRYDDATQCQAFPITLSKAAQSWFQALPPGKINSFNQLGNMFVNQFVATRKRKYHAMHLLNIEQAKGETLRAYIRRFNDAILDVENASTDTITAAIMKGTTNEKFRENLIVYPPTTVEEVLSRAQTFMHLEDTLTSTKKEQENTPQERRPPLKGNTPHPPGRKGPLSIQDRLASLNLIPINAPAGDILRAARQEQLLLDDPPKMPPTNAPVDKSKFCDYHKAPGHTSNECIRLHMDINRLMKNGLLQQFAKQDANANVPREQERRDNRQDNRRNDRQNARREAETIR